jgi:hypothetical protein
VDSPEYEAGLLTTQLLCCSWHVKGGYEAIKSLNFDLQYDCPDRMFLVFLTSSGETVGSLKGSDGFSTCILY